MLEALSDAVIEKKKEEAEGWSMERELLALQAELVHSLLLVTLRVHGAKSVGEPLHIPRPWESDIEVPSKPSVSFGQFASNLRQR
jgi:hypothetical protein